MIEARAIIKDIAETKNKLEALGAVFDSDYAFKDVIFVPQKDRYDLNGGFLRARVYIKNNWPTKKVVLVKKQIKFKNVGKEDTIILRQEFDTEQQASDFVKKEFGSEFKRSFEYEREGWQYNLEGCRIFVEDIKGYKPSIEIETDTEDQINSLFEKIGVVEKIKTSIPEAMRQILTKKE